jgi:small-conductance mechanosensitive channel
MMLPASQVVVDVLHREFLRNSVQAWLTGALTAAIVLFIGLLARRLLVARLGTIASRTTNHIDDMVVSMIGETRVWVIIAFAIFAGLAPLYLPPRLEGAVAPAMKLVFLWQAAVWGVAGVAFWVRHQLDTRTGTHSHTSIAMIGALGIGAKVLIWVLIFITSLRSVFNVEITPLITGLGVGGIAVALAVQNILGDVLAALAIVFDKPFDVGDPIGVDQISGTVEHIGLKTTRLRSDTGEQIIIGNGDLLKSRLRNYKRQQFRRWIFRIDITLETPPDLIARVPKMIEEIITKQNPVKFERSHVALLTEFSARIETSFVVLDPDYSKYIAIQQAINLEILKRLAAEKVKLAYPTRTVFFEGETVGAREVPSAPPVVGT